MTTMLVIDHSIQLTFDTPWQAREWDGTPEQQAIAAGRSKWPCVDVLGLRPKSDVLFIEVKDHRVLTPAQIVTKQRTVGNGSFLQGIAKKFSCSVQDVLGLAQTSGIDPVFMSLAAEWSAD